MIDKTLLIHKRISLDEVVCGEKRATFLAREWEPVECPECLAKKEEYELLKRQKEEEDGYGLEGNY